MQQASKQVSRSSGDGSRAASSPRAWPNSDLMTQLSGANTLDDLSKIFAGRIPSVSPGIDGVLSALLHDCGCDDLTRPVEYRRYLGRISRRHRDETPVKFALLWALRLEQLAGRSQGITADPPKFEIPIDFAPARREVLLLLDYLSGSCDPITSPSDISSFAGLNSHTPGQRLSFQAELVFQILQLQGRLSEPQQPESTIGSPAVLKASVESFRDLRTFAYQTTNPVLATPASTVKEVFELVGGFPRQLVGEVLDATGLQLACFAISSLCPLPLRSVELADAVCQILITSPDVRLRIQAVELARALGLSEDPVARQHLLVCYHNEFVRLVSMGLDCSLVRERFNMLHLLIATFFCGALWVDPKANLNSLIEKLVGVCDRAEDATSLGELVSILLRLKKSVVGGSVGVAAFSMDSSPVRRSPEIIAATNAVNEVTSAVYRSIASRGVDFFWSERIPVGFRQLAELGNVNPETLVERVLLSKFKETEPAAVPAEECLFGLLLLGTYCQSAVGAGKTVDDPSADETSAKAMQRLRSSLISRVTQQYIYGEQLSDGAIGQINWRDEDVKPILAGLVEPFEKLKADLDTAERTFYEYQRRWSKLTSILLRFNFTTANDSFDSAFSVHVMELAETIRLQRGNWFGFDPFASQLEKSHQGQWVTWKDKLGRFLDIFRRRHVAARNS